MKFFIFFFKILPSYYIYKIINYINFIITEIPEIDDLNFDSIYKDKINKKKICILDVGAGKGESITRYLHLFNTKNIVIHAFEPINESFNKIKKKYNNNKKVCLVNCAAGNKNTYKKFFLNESSNTSSFFEINKKSNHLFNNSTKKIIKIKQLRLANYLKEKNINKIDIVKIDTQGYENEVLKGLMGYLKFVNFIEIEMICTDYYKKENNFFEIEKIIKKDFKLISIKKIVKNSQNRILWMDILYENKNKKFL